MANGTATITVDAKLAAAYNAAPKARQKRALSALRQALQTATALKPKAPQLSKKETELFLKLQRDLPEEKQRRYEELTEKRLAETLTKKEHAELLALITESEQIWVERWQAVLELAALRQITPQEMLRQLGVDPEKYG